jgi:hypothetical protein
MMVAERYWWSGIWEAEGCNAQSLLPLSSASLPRHADRRGDQKAMGQRAIRLPIDGSGPTSLSGAAGV